MPKTWKIAYYPSDGKFAWTLTVDGVPVYDSPESYPTEAACQEEIGELKHAAVEKKDKKPKKG
jgi:hypothetical protein